MEAVSVENGRLSLVSLPEYGDVGCDGFDYLSHHKYGLLSLDPIHARFIEWKSCPDLTMSYHVPRVISELFTQALDSPDGMAGGRSKHDLMMEMIGWRHAQQLGS